MKRYIYLLFFILINSFSSAADTPFQLKKLQVEYAVTPLGIDVENPRFSWQMEGMTDERGLSQKARQIIVTDEAGVQVWDSERIPDNKSLNIEYAGLPLKARMPFFLRRDGRRLPLVRRFGVRTSLLR